MKSATRTVLDDTLTSVTSYSSGPLFVGDLYELAVDFNITNTTGGVGGFVFYVSRIAADGSLHKVGEYDASGSSPEVAQLSIGAGLTGTQYTPYPSSGLPSSSFGDQIQVDLLNPNGWTITGRISVLGK